MSKVLMIADLHLGHQNAIKWRPQFPTPEEHDEIIMDNILSSGTKRDTLYLLGDCFLGPPPNTSVPARRLNDYFNKVHLILGNHDTERRFTGKRRDET